MLLIGFFIIIRRETLLRGRRKKFNSKVKLNYDSTKLLKLTGVKCGETEFYIRKSFWKKNCRDNYREF